MSDKNKDEEIERINKRKIEEILMRKRAQQTHSGKDANSKPITLTDSNFFSEVSKYPLVVVDFWAAWCGPCRMVSPSIEQLASEYSGKVVFGNLNVYENPMVSNTFGVQSIPTLLVFKSGRRVDGLVGAVPKSLIESKIIPYLDNNRSESVYR